MKKVKAVVTDLNGTLLLPSGTMGEFTKRVINKLISEGKKFFIATGRSKNEIFNLTKSFDLHDTHYITLNGARVYNNSWQRLIEHDIKSDVIRDILDLKNKHYVDFIHCIYKVNDEDRLYLEKNGLERLQVEDRLIDKSNRKFSTIDSFNSFENLNNIALVLVSALEDELISYERMILERHKGAINAYLSNPTTLEIVDNNVSKGKALKEVLSKYGIDLSETVAFGNGFNDFDMLFMSGKGIMTRNSNERLKKALPDLEVIDNSNTESVARYINENILDEPI